jgi:hypothetical protein
VYQVQRSEVLNILEKRVISNLEICRDAESKNNSESLKYIFPELKKAQEEVDKFKKEKKTILPLELFVYNEVKLKNIPCIVVTSLKHHSASFEPFKFKDFLLILNFNL